MGTINNRTNAKGKTSYLARIRITGHPPQVKTFKRKTDAKEWITQTEAAIQQGQFVPTVEARRRTVADVITGYIAAGLPNPRGRQKAAKTIRNQIQQLEWWTDKIGTVTIADAEGGNSSAIEDARDGLEAERTAATVGRYLASLSVCFNWAMGQKPRLMRINPLVTVTRPAEDNARVRFLRPDERARLLKACKQSTQPDLYCAVVLSLATGARQGEIMGLTWGRVDLARGTALLDATKNGAHRTLHLYGHALDLLRDRAKIRRIDTDLVFPGGNPQKPVILRKPWLQAVEAAEVDNFKWHDLRHTFATDLLHSGATLPELAGAMGHKSLIMVQRYAHESDDHKASVVERMNRAIFGS